MNIFIVLVFAVFGLAQGASLPTTQCKSDTDCPATQCCFDPSELLASKRGDPLHLTHGHGQCQDYLSGGSPCGYMNHGLCGCNQKAGYHCVYVAPEELLGSKRGALPSSMGRYFCKSKTPTGN